ASRAKLGMPATDKARSVVRRVSEAMGVRLPRQMHGKTTLLRQFLGYEEAAASARIPATRAATKRSSRSAKKKGFWGDDFFDSREWRELRYQVLKHYGRKCMLCGCTSGEMHVDHIKPRSKYPELALEFTNLQVLCRPCNLGKSNWDETDWRPPQKDDVFF